MEEADRSKPQKRKNQLFEMITCNLGRLESPELLRIAEIAWALAEAKEVFKNKERRDGGWHVPF
jgi:hypothetical protein